MARALLNSDPPSLLVMADYGIDKGYSLDEIEIDPCDRSAVLFAKNISGDNCVLAGGKQKNYWFVFGWL